MQIATHLQHRTPLLRCYTVLFLLPTPVSFFVEKEDDNTVSVLISATNISLFDPNFGSFGLDPEDHAKFRRTLSEGFCSIRAGCMNVT